MNQRFNYEEALGKLIGNLLSLEFLLRAFLHRYFGENTIGKTNKLDNFEEGDFITCNQLTNYDSLDALISSSIKYVNKKSMNYSIKTQ